RPEPAPGQDAEPRRVHSRYAPRRQGDALHDRLPADRRGQVEEEESAMWPRAIVVVLVACLSVVSSATAQAPLTVGLDGTFAPHAMPKLGGGVEGFNVDMANEIGRRLGRPITVVAQEFSGLVPGMNAKRFDFLVAPVT